jgi:uncharacterized protein
VIVYESTKQGFLSDCDDRTIEQVVSNKFAQKAGRYATESEYRSWRESLKHMSKVLRHSEIPSDVGVGIEFGIPQSQKRVDFIITGYADNGEPRMIIVELKQWSTARVSDYDGVIYANRGGRAETLGAHPSYQAWSYAALLKGFNEFVYENSVDLNPCAYLHNYASDGVINDARYAPYIERAPLFLEGEGELRRLREFVSRHVRKGDSGALLYSVENGRIRPSKMLADSLVGMLKGNREFILIDEQKVAYEAALAAARSASEKRKCVVLIKGGPGTGKSVVAINLLSSLTKLGMLAKYVSKNAAPRAVYQAKLTGSMASGVIANLFGGSGAFHDCAPNTFDALIVDEAHRLNRFSGLFGNLGENQVMEIVRSAKCSIFFVDDDQVVTLNDIGSASEIRQWAGREGAEVIELELGSQFRCNGSAGYLEWLDDVLGVKNADTDSFDRTSFDFRLVDTPKELHDLIAERNGSNRARVVAGYCWDWNSKKDPNADDIVIGAYRRQWNLGSDGSLWIMSPTSVQQVGCIHTCQGLEVDYIGVIVGPDLLYRDGQLVTAVENRSRMDRSVRGYRAAKKRDPQAAMSTVDRLIRNTYRTLMTRGLKGCYVHSVDLETQGFLQHCLEKVRSNVSR